MEVQRAFQNYLCRFSENIYGLRSNCNQTWIFMAPSFIKFLSLHFDHFSHFTSFPSPFNQKSVIFYPYLSLNPTFTSAFLRCNENQQGLQPEIHNQQFSKVPKFPKFCLYHVFHIFQDQEPPNSLLLFPKELPNHPKP